MNYSISMSPKNEMSTGLVAVGYCTKLQVITTSIVQSQTLRKAWLNCPVTDLWDKNHNLNLLLKKYDVRFRIPLSKTSYL